MSNLVEKTQNKG